jgi:16S rRNA (uracil1498-N3)-methyltransferase
MPRFFCPAPLATGAALDLPSGAARHVQVLRLQPGDTITLFNGESGGEFDAAITHMGRSDVQVQVGAHHAVEREARRAVHLAVGMPANERMDWLVEKATELGVASIQPLMTERSVLRLSGERADKKVAHWHSVAVAACEQCGGNRVPLLHPVRTFFNWLANSTGGDPSVGLLLSLNSDAKPLRTLVSSESGQAITFLSGPEGGLSAVEENLALKHGYQPVTLGPRVLRAETAALAALSAMLI